MHLTRSYDTIYVYSKAIQTAKAFNIDIVKREILDLNFSGASGQVMFDANGCVKKKPVLWKVVSDGFVRFGDE